MPDILHWLGIKKIDRMLSMSNMKHDAIVESGIKILERIPIPDEMIPQDSRVEIDAKINAGYFTTGKNVTAEDLAAVRGRGWEKWEDITVCSVIRMDLNEDPADKSSTDWGFNLHLRRTMKFRVHHYSLAGDDAWLAQHSGLWSDICLHELLNIRDVENKKKVKMGNHLLPGKSERVYSINYRSIHHPQVQLTSSFYTITLI